MDKGVTSFLGEHYSQMLSPVNGEMSPSYVLTEKEIIKIPAYSLLQYKC